MVLAHILIRREREREREREGERERERERFKIIQDFNTLQLVILYRMNRAKLAME